MGKSLQMQQGVLKCVTENTSVCQDDAESVTLSRDSRSVFPSYWRSENDHDSKGIPGQKFRVHRSCSPTSVSDIDHTGRCGMMKPGKMTPTDSWRSQNIYENSLLECEQENKSYSSLQEQWNRLNPWGHRSAPSFRAWITPPFGGRQQQRSVQSDAALHSASLKPALRRGKFSNSREQTLKDPQNISFSQVVTVRSFHPPAALYAEEGWSSWFTN